MRRAGAIVGVATLALSVALSGCAPAQPVETVESGTGVFPDAAVEPLVAAVPERTVKALPQARLAEGLLPPTNRWFSGLVFGEPSMPVFPLPLSFGLTDTGFAFGLPAVTASEKTIMGAFAPAIDVDLGADEQRVSAYDAASITVAQIRGNTELGHTVVAQGSPFVSFTASGEVTAALGVTFDEAAGDGAWTTQVAGETYGLVTTGVLSGTSVTLGAGDTLTWFAVASGGDVDEFVAAARHPVVSTGYSYSLDGDTATTSIDYATTDGSPTLVAALPHQKSAASSCASGSYASIYGAMTVCAVSTLSWSVAALRPAGTLDLSGLSDDQTSQLAEQVAADVATTGTFPTDTYYGGKALYRAVNLWSIAMQVGATDAADALKTRIVAELDDWMDPAGCGERANRCFVYDAAAHGIVGLDASFGADEFNDHHFHYGYFLSVAGVLAADDAALAATWAPVMDLLAADIATGAADATRFPQLRTFDVYAGHSWASGTSPFADGNNQESSSEAVNAYNGLALWAAASNNEPLEAEATWLLSAEAASAQAYWTNFDLDDPAYDGFDHSVTSLVWGGKRDWATWFSPEPSAMLGILVLPMSPVSQYLAGDPERIRTNLADAAPDGFDVLFGDYLLMYSALAGAADASAALTAARSLNEDRIDDGDSRSYLLAWLMLQARS
jgi:endoglucanase Acf2